MQQHRAISPQDFSKFSASCEAQIGPSARNGTAATDGRCQSGVRGWDNRSRRERSLGQQVAVFNNGERAAHMVSCLFMQSCINILRHMAVSRQSALTPGIAEGSGETAACSVAILIHAEQLSLIKRCATAAV